MLTLARWRGDDRRSAPAKAVSCVHWYPVDTGMFLTGGYEGRVTVWDTETFKPATAFERQSRVHTVAMSPIAVRHSVVAGAVAALC